MIEMTLGEVAAVAGGRICHADPDTTVTRPASVDSRTVEEGSLFVAVAGEHVDGHDFVSQAVAGGAVAALTNREVEAPCVVVDDTVVALGRIAGEVRRRLPGCTVVGITGSQGKTGTKDLVEQLLGRAGETVATAANFNNEIGLPLTVLRATGTTSFLVLEMGARRVGNIADLCAVACPSVGVVLNVGVAHLGEFGTREKIARAKGELIESLPQDGRAVLNADDAAVAAMTTRTRAEVVTFGAGAEATVRVRGLALDSSGEPGFDLEYAGRRAAVHLPLLGAHQAYNAAAAAAVALVSGVGLEEVADGLRAAESRSEWRMERHRRADGVVIVNDAYNANPDSMRAALGTLAAMAVQDGARTVAVLGEMLELGATAHDEHERVGGLAVELGIAQVVSVGAGAAAIAEGVRRADDGRGETRSVHVADGDEAVAWLAPRLQGGDRVLVKASRASGLERVASALLASPGDNAPGRTTAGEGNDSR